MSHVRYGTYHDRVGRLQRFFASRSGRLTSWIIIIWMLALLFPYLLVGETWGMIWFYLALPMSRMFKFIWDSDDPIFYVIVATVTQALFLFIIAFFFAMKQMDRRSGPLPAR